MTRIPRFLLSTACIAGLSLIQVTTTGQSPQPSQRDEVDLIIGERIGTPPSFAVPDCLTRTPDAATAEAARTIAQVLRDDLEFEREFRIIPRDIYRTIPVARSLEDLPFDRWQELGADGVISCTVEATSDSQIEIMARLFSVRSLESAFGGLQWVEPQRAALRAAAVRRDPPAPARSPGCRPDTDRLRDRPV